MRAGACKLAPCCWRIEPINPPINPLVMDSHSFMNLEFLLRGSLGAIVLSMCELPGTVAKEALVAIES